MYRKITDFLTDWKSEADLTLKVFGAITDNALHIKIHPDVRTAGRLSWHITQTLTEMPAHAGLLPTDILEKEPCPQTMAAIMETYNHYAANLATAVQAQWTDASLEEQTDMYGEQWTKGFILMVLITHQIHHRAQLTVIMRQLGLKVPGTYGPAKEEWENLGMTPAE